ncbi:MAG: metallophosphoesterase family protein [Ignavibacteriaceae bacterium]
MTSKFKIFFATDLHGSTSCFRKLLAAKKFYNVDYLFLGGDLSGKRISFINKNHDGSYQINNSNDFIHSEKELNIFFESCEKQGIYYEILDSNISELTQNEISEIHKKKVYDRLNSWLELIEEKLNSNDKVIAVAGNDDSFKIDDILKQNSKIILADLKKHNLDGLFNVLGYSFSTPTPWKTAREKNEYEIDADLSAVNFENDQIPLILNFHVPPKGIGLDSTTALNENLEPIMGSGGVQKINVGSSSVYNFVKKMNPCLGLFGHVHEAKGISKIDNTICINPGSVYYEGNLQGCICSFSNNKLISWQLTEG